MRRPHGFRVHRRDHDEGEAYYLNGMKSFAETDPGFPTGAQYLTNLHPIQSFQWADHSAKPGHRYTYTITALKGRPDALAAYIDAVVEVETESPEGGDHDVYFNRGVAASQAYVTRFGDRTRNKVPNNQAWDWLSRGLYEAMVAFVMESQPGRHSLRIAAYEFHYVPFLKVVKGAIERGVNVEVVYDGRGARPAMQTGRRYSRLMPREAAPSANIAGSARAIPRTSPTTSSS